MASCSADTTALEHALKRLRKKLRYSCRLPYVPRAARHRVTLAATPVLEMLDAASQDPTFTVSELLSSVHTELREFVEKLRSSTSMQRHIGKDTMQSVSSALAALLDSKDDLSSLAGNIAAANAMAEASDRLESQFESVAAQMKRLHIGEEEKSRDDIVDRSLLGLLAKYDQPFAVEASGLFIVVHFQHKIPDDAERAVRGWAAQHGRPSVSLRVFNGVVEEMDTIAMQSAGGEAPVGDDCCRGDARRQLCCRGGQVLDLPAPGRAS